MPREVSFFGLAFAGGFVPAAAARAFCFFVANLSLLGPLDPVRPMLLPVPAFERAESAALLEAVRRGVSAYRDERRWREIQRRGMVRDFSWSGPARQYADLYARHARSGR